jgi:hypothetical protein
MHWSLFGVVVVVELFHQGVEEEVDVHKDYI